MLTRRIVRRSVRALLAVSALVLPLSGIATQSETDAYSGERRYVTTFFGWHVSTTDDKNAFPTRAPYGSSAPVVWVVGNRRPLLPIPRPRRHWPHVGLGFLHWQIEQAFADSLISRDSADAAHLLLGDFVLDPEHAHVSIVWDESAGLVARAQDGSNLVIAPPRGG